MADPRFFHNAGPFSAAEIARLIGAELRPADSGDRRFSDVGALGDADADTLSFLDNRKYRPALRASAAGGIILAPEFADEAPEHAVLFLSPEPYRAFALAAQRFYPVAPPTPGVHATATVAADATIAEAAQIDAGAVIGPGAEIGAGAWIGANAVVDAGVVVGEGTQVGAGAYLGYCLIGRQCQIHSGARIGNRGFGFAMDARGHVDVPQLGRVIVGDGVEIGANSCIDRGMGPDTVIGDGSKIDNLVQIGHNVRIGRGCVLVGQCGIAGSTVLEDFAVCAAQSGVAGHLTIGKGAQVAAQSGVIRDAAPGEKLGGTPAVPLRQWHRQTAYLAQRSERGKTNNK